MRARIHVCAGRCTCVCPRALALRRACAHVPIGLGLHAYANGFALICMGPVGPVRMQMATGSPPYSDLHPMRVLFLIPKNAPPKLEGDFSPEFKDFVDR